jgi:hypothetical protein
MSHSMHEWFEFSHAKMKCPATGPLDADHCNDGVNIHGSYTTQISHNSIYDQLDQWLMRFNSHTVSKWK